MTAGGHTVSNTLMTLSFLHSCSTPISSMSDPCMCRKAKGGIGPLDLIELSHVNCTIG